MLTTDVQDKLRELITRAHEIYNEFESGIEMAHFDGLNLEKYIQKMEEEFHLSVDGVELYKSLTVEVSKNLRLVSRDSTEFMYLKGLDGLFCDINALVQLQKGDSLKKSLSKIGREFVDSGDLDDVIGLMVYIVSYNCRRIKDACLDSATLLRNSLFVFQNRAEFQNIIMFCDESNKAKGLSMQPDQAPLLVEPVPTPAEPGGKLRWNGANDTLYDVFRQLKNHHLPDGSALIEGSYDQIAAFIQKSFIGFDDVATSTIRGKLTKNARPKKSFNRIDLDFTETD